MRFVLVILIFCTPALATHWLFYPAAFVTVGDKSDGAALLETTWLMKIGRNDRQFYTLAYTHDRLDADDWGFTQHTGLLAASWPVKNWSLSVAAAALNGRLKEVPRHFAPLNQGVLGAVRVLKHENDLKWGLQTDSYGERRGLQLQHFGVLAEWQALPQLSLVVSEQVTSRGGEENLYSTTAETRLEITGSLIVFADAMLGKTALPFSWSTFVLNNTPTPIEEMYGIKCEWSVSSSLGVTGGYRFTGYENANAKYFFGGIRLRILSH